jgi:hypothetical protein
LGYDPFFAWAHDTLFAEIQREGSVFRAAVKLVDENNWQRGSRAIAVQGSDCSVVIDALGLTISLTIDPSSVAGPARPPPAREPDSPPQPLPPEPPPLRATPREVPASHPPAARAWSLHAGIGGVGSWNAAPSPTVGVTVLVGAAWRGLSVDLEGRADDPAGGAPTQGQQGQGRTWLIEGSLVPCVHVSALFGCLVVGAGALGASAQNVAHATHEYGPWVAAGGRLGAEWMASASAWGFRGYAELLGTIARDSLFIDGVPVYKVSPWSADVGLALVLRFR